MCSDAAQSRPQSTARRLWRACGTRRTCWPLPATTGKSHCPMAPPATCSRSLRSVRGALAGRTLCIAAWPGQAGACTHPRCCMQHAGVHAHGKPLPVTAPCAVPRSLPQRSAAVQRTSPVWSAGAVAVWLQVKDDPADLCVADRKDDGYARKEVRQIAKLGPWPACLPSCLLLTLGHAYLLGEAFGGHWTSACRTYMHAAGPACLLLAPSCACRSPCTIHAGRAGLLPCRAQLARCLRSWAWRVRAWRLAPASPHRCLMGHALTGHALP